MTVFSANVNKIALLRNSRGNDYPSLPDFIVRLLELGVRGITVHPRPDQRHVTRQDVRAISALLRQYQQVEFNIEGYPSEEFLALVLEVRPAQCTLVPDEPGQLTSDHGWDVVANRELLQEITTRLRDAGIRSSLFMDPNPKLMSAARATGTDRVELYTEEYARAFGTARENAVFARYRDTALQAAAIGLGVNAGHDLNQDNLPGFLRIPGIEEVSIGHAMVVESLYQGLTQVIGSYLAICQK
ncbi:MAG: pyridoxine 5'-phosphate synthase [Pseudomonadales bacterium]|nr:pyridoxine 5'-phosphate synthase [Pseudomonadales bacterium]